MKAIVRIIMGRLFLLVLSFEKLWDRLRGLAFEQMVEQRGKNCRFEGGGQIIHVQNLFLGNDVWIGRDFFIRATGSVSVGSYTHISRNVTIHTVNHNYRGNLLPYDRQDQHAAVKIGRYVWIGMNVCILPGVTIGDGAVIAMGTVVSKDVAAGAVVAGAGQRSIGQRNSEVTESLVTAGRFLEN